MIYTPQLWKFNTWRETNSASHKRFYNTGQVIANFYANYCLLRAKRNIFTFKKNIPL